MDFFIDSEIIISRPVKLNHLIRSTKDMLIELQLLVAKLESLVLLYYIYTRLLNSVVL